MIKEDLSPLYLIVMSRHLLSVAPRNFHFQGIEGEETTVKYRTILGVDQQVFIFLCIGLGIILTILLIIFVLYRRYRTRVDYNENPEQFPHLPDLDYMEERRLNKIQFVNLMGKVDWKSISTFQGPIFEVIFRENQPSGLYVNLEQKAQSYFQIQVLQLNGDVEIGFMQIESTEKVQLREEEVGYVGVSLSTSGFVVANGENVYNYNWNLDYGDVIGIGITKESDKFNERRAWISKNGVLLNFPPFDEMDKWLATVEITAEEREKFNVSKDKEKTEDVHADAEAADKAAEEEKNAIEREQNMLRNQRISLKTFKEYKYYPTIFFPGSRQDPNKEKKKRTSINLNVGGQIFRMQEGLFKAGILK